MKDKTVTIYTLGCRLNIYESDGILQQFLRHGYRYRYWEEGADVTIINTCSVTHQADRKNKYIIRSLLKKNPETKVIITGCYAQTDVEELQKIPNILAIVGNDNKHRIYEIFQEIEKRNGEKNETTIFSSGSLQKEDNLRIRLQQAFFQKRNLPVDHTRAYLKIQDGCDRKCSYCKVPMARGAGVSRQVEDVIEEIVFLDGKKIPEIVLTGVNIGRYREGRVRFADLLEMILETVTYSRIRISSIEPSDVNDKLVKLLHHPKLCKFLHVPLQSGSDRILRLMKRSYSSKTFTLRVEKVLRDHPDIFLGTDIITGFPEETDDDFRKTVSLIKELRFANIHVFPFSLRKGTFIEEYVKKNPGSQVPSQVVKERTGFLQNLKKELFLEYALRNLNKTFEGIVEEIHGDTVEVLTDNYLRIRVPVNNGVRYRKGDVLPVILESAGSDGILRGSAVTS